MPNQFADEPFPGKDTASREKYIPGAMKQLAYTVGTILNAIDDLEKRLDSVLMSEEVMNASNAKAERSTDDIKPPLAMSIQQENDRLEMAYRRLNTIFHRLEI